ncbi:MAG: radical SAM protein [Clostridia bacterium]|nr:radical SAM protein [Clostridia bacterium]
MRHINIPVFIPHRGCPNASVFCNQHLIAGSTCVQDDAALIRSAEATIEEALIDLPADADVEIAYFGGSFTGIGQPAMEGLLALAAKYVDTGRVSGIRLSTRPDYVGEEILDCLCRYPVRTVELGIQSLSDDVLQQCRRGHSAAQAIDACRRVRVHGFSLVGQMMLGLPGSRQEDERMTAETLASLGVDAVRVYPTLVLSGTELAAQFAAGSYLPLGLDEAVCRAADVLEIFDAAGIPVLRVGLQETDDLRSEDSVLAGPHHPAFGELCLGEIFYRRIAEALSATDVSGQTVTVAVPRGRLSAAIGQKKKNIARLCTNFGCKTIKMIEMDTLFRYNIKIV